MRRLQIITLPQTGKRGIRSRGYNNACVHDAVQAEAYQFVSDRLTRRMMNRKTTATVDLLKLEDKTDAMSKLEVVFWRLCRAHRLDPKTTSSDQLIAHLVDNDEFEAYMIVVHNVADRYITLHAHLALSFYEDRGVPYF